MPTTCSDLEFTSQKEQFIGRMKTFRIRKKRGTKILYMGSEAVSMHKDKKKKTVKNKRLSKEVVNLISSVARNVNNFILKSGFEFEVEHERHSSTFTNRDLYKNMKVGQEFYYIDIAHCYWRIAYLNGYISESLYTAVLKKPKLKLYRNMALACIIATESCEYYVHGEKVLEIEENKDLHRLIYDTIRFTCYNLMGDIVDFIGEQYIIGYRTDGILVLPECKDEVARMIMEQDFNCTQKKMTKVDDHFYKNEKGDLKHL